MKKHIILTALLLGLFSCGNAFAQFNLTVGYHRAAFTSGSTLTVAEDLDSQPMNNIFIGVGYKFMLSEGLFFTPSLEYSMGERDRDFVSLAGLVAPVPEVSLTSNDHRLNVPLRLSYELDLAPGVFKIIPYAGPVLSAGLSSLNTYALSGKSANITGRGDFQYNNYSDKVTESNISHETAQLISAVLGNQPMNRFDLYLGGGIGFEILDTFTIRGGYDYGFLNRYKSSGKSLKSRGFHVALTVGF